MSNGARHTWGFVAGVVLTAALAALLIFGTYRLQHGYLTQFHKQDKWIGGGLLLGAAVVYAILAASRLSPVASLIGGIVLTAAGVLFFISQKTTADLINRFPYKPQRVTLSGLEEEGFILFAGVGLLFASLFPSRWRTRGDADTSGYEFGLPEAHDNREMRGPYATNDPTSGLVGGPAGDPLAGHYTVHDEQPTAQTQYDSPQGGYDSPLYEPTQQQYGRPPFSPSEESGATREMRRRE